MMGRKLAPAALLAALVAMAALIAAGTGSARQQAAFKAAWIYVGPHNDAGWSQAHDESRQYVQKTLGSKVQTTYKENVPEGPQVAGSPVQLGAVPAPAPARPLLRSFAIVSSAAVLSSFPQVQPAESSSPKNAMHTVR